MATAEVTRAQRSQQYRNTITSAQISQFLPTVMPTHAAWSPSVLTSHSSTDVKGHKETTKSSGMGSFTDGQTELMPWGYKIADDIFCFPWGCKELDTTEQITTTRTSEKATDAIVLMWERVCSLGKDWEMGEGECMINLGRLFV